MSASKRSPKDGPMIHGGTRDARKTAAVILEVLTGLVRPQDGATAVGVSVNRYYQMERRALEGMVKGCEPKPMGKRRKPEVLEAELKGRIRRLENEVARHQAIARAAQKAMGILPPKVDPKRRKPRRLPVRAVKMVKSLQKPEEAPAQA